MNEPVESPRGDILLQTRPMPEDTAPDGHISGGWIMSQLDIAGGLLAGEIAQGRIVNVAVESLSFLRPVHVGDTIRCYGECIRIGRTSLQVRIEVWASRRPADGPAVPAKVTEAVTTYVALDHNGRPRPVKPS